MDATARLAAVEALVGLALLVFVPLVVATLLRPLLASVGSHARD